MKGWQVYRIAFFIPVMMSGVVVATIWANMFEFNHGLSNTVLWGIGLDGLVQNWLGDRNVALISVMLVPIWQSVGFPMIVLLAAIEGIPQDMHDAATMDGVNEWQRIWGLIVPLIKPVLASITMLSIIGAMKVFNIVLVMTKGGPAFSTQVLGYYLFETAFRSGYFGYGSTIAVVMFVVVFAIAYAYVRGVRIESVEYWDCLGEGVPDFLDSGPGLESQFERIGRDGCKQVSFSFAGRERRGRQDVGLVGRQQLAANHLWSADCGSTSSGISNLLSVDEHAQDGYADTEHAFQSANGLLHGAIY